MKNIIFSILVAMLLCCSCEENEMIRFDSHDRINFLGDYSWTNTAYSRGTWTEVVDYYSYSVNFGVNELGENRLYDTLLIGVNIMGRIADHPRKVTLKLDLPEENALEVVFPEEYSVPADTVRNSFPVLIKRPVKRGIVYTAKLVFDYDHSDFSAGTEERQSIALTTQDSVSVDLWHASNWDNGAKYLGEYSDQKARFLITYYGCTSFDTWYTATKGKKVAADLASYREACEANPALPEFLEEDGQWITFP